MNWPNGSASPWPPSRPDSIALAAGSARNWPICPPNSRHPTMTEIDALPPSDDLIDRIVDGALTPAELRAAIDQVDRMPDGWKRCAAAFLEAQCWRESLRTMGEPARPQDAGQSLHFPITVPKARHAAGRWVRARKGGGDRRRFVRDGLAGPRVAVED